MSKKPDRSKELSQLAACLGDWRSLVVVPVAPGISAEPVAQALVDAANLIRPRQTKLFSAVGIDINAVSMLVDDMVKYVEAGGIAVVATDAVVSRQTAVPLTLAADAALLVVHLGVAKMEDAQTTLAALGHKKFIGAVTVENRP